MQETSLTPSAAKPSRLGWFDDVLLLGIMAVLAGCGLIYEYLLSHYAGRILGALEAAIYTMIGLMIVSMGLGAFAARKIRDAFTGFVILELTVALCGSLAILITAAVIGFGQQLPLMIANTLGFTTRSTTRRRHDRLAAKTQRILTLSVGRVTGPDDWYGNSTDRQSAPITL